MMKLGNFPQRGEEFYATPSNFILLFLKINLKYSVKEFGGGSWIIIGKIKPHVGLFWNALNMSILTALLIVIQKDLAGKRPTHNVNS